MTKNTIQVIENNIQYLKSCLDLTEAHITWGNRNIKKKYSIIKTRLLNKIKEQLIDKTNYIRSQEDFYCLDVY
jgi:hypothetical protein